MSSKLRGRVRNTGRFFYSAVVAQPIMRSDRACDCVHGRLRNDTYLRRRRSRRLHVAAQRVANVAVTQAAQTQQRAATPSVTRINAGVLDVGYYELGPKDGPPALLLHGFPYSILASSRAAATTIFDRCENATICVTATPSASTSTTTSVVRTYASASAVANDLFIAYSGAVKPMPRTV